MKKIMFVCALVAIVALGGIAVSSPADARNRGAIIGGVVGGLAVGAIIGGAAAQQRGYYDGGYHPAYAAPRSCVVQEEVWSRRYQQYVVRNVRVAC